MPDNSVKIERTYAIVLAERGIEEFAKLADNDREYHINQLMLHGLPGIFFVRRRFSYIEARIYATQHPSQAYRHFSTQVLAYGKLLEDFRFLKEQYLKMNRKEARKLLRFERNNDHGGFYS